MEKDFEIYRGKKERVKSIALKAKKESSDDETSTSRSDDEEYAMAVRNFKKSFRRKGKFDRQAREEKKSFRQRDEKKGKSGQNCFRCGDPNHLIGDCPKPTRNKDQKAVIGGSWSDSKNDAEDKTNDETCLMAQSSNEVTLNSSYYSDNVSFLDIETMQIEYDSLCEIRLKIINNNKTLKTKRDLLEKEVLELNEKIKKLERSKEIDIACSSIVAIRMDHGREFDNEVQFGAYCDAQGITHNFSAPRTPKSNGVVESSKMPSEYQQDYKKTRAYALKIYNDPKMSDELRDIYRTLESRTVHESVDKEGKTIHKFPNQIETNELFNHLRPCELVIRDNVYSAIGNRDHTQEVIALMLYCLENRQPFNLAYFINRRMYVFRDRKDKVLPYGMILSRLFKNLKANMVEHPFDECYKLIPRKMSPLKAKQPKKPPPKRARNVGKSKRP
ncbi:zf-CCHC domain-containing protein [Tanacetum coccineum]